MNKNVLKSTFKAASNVLLILALGLMVVAVYLENFYLSIGGLVLSAASIVITVLSADELKAKSIFKELNIFYTFVFIAAVVVVLFASGSTVEGVAPNGTPKINRLFLIKTTNRILLCNLTFLLLNEETLYLFGGHCNDGWLCLLGAGS